MINLIVFLIIGAIAGWLAGQIMKGSGYGLVGNILMGVIGAVVGGFLFDLLNVGGGGLIWQIFSATIGAVVVIWVARRLR